MCSCVHLSYIRKQLTTKPERNQVSAVDARTKIMKILRRTPAGTKSKKNAPYFLACVTDGRQETILKALDSEVARCETELKTGFVYEITDYEEENTSASNAYSEGGLIVRQCTTIKQSDTEIEEPEHVYSEIASIQELQTGSLVSVRGRVAFVGEPV